MLLTAADEAALTIADDPQRPGARIGIAAAPHLRLRDNVSPARARDRPGRGNSLDVTHWVSCRPGFFLPVRVVSRLFQRLFLRKLLAAYQAGRLAFSSDHAALAEPGFSTFLASLRKA